MSEAAQVPHVYAAIAEVTKKMSAEGISKTRKNQQQGYQFRGIDDVYNALAPMLADCQLCILPNVKDRIVTERESKSGSVLFYVVVHVDFDFVSAVDGSKHIVSTYGEAMDSADKATNKAMSAAYKYACMQAFCIPTEGDNDADSHTPQPTAKQRQKDMAATKIAALTLGATPDQASAMASEEPAAPPDDALLMLVEESIESMKKRGAPLPDKAKFHAAIDDIKVGYKALGMEPRYREILSLAGAKDRNDLLKDAAKAHGVFKVLQLDLQNQKARAAQGGNNAA